MLLLFYEIETPPYATPANKFWCKKQYFGIFVDILDVDHGESREC